MGHVTPEQYQRVVGLLADYAVLIDGRRAVEWAELFGDAGQLVYAGNSTSGRAALTEFAATSPIGTHLGGPPRVCVVGDRIIAESNFVFVRADKPVVMSGCYTDEIDDDVCGATFSSRSIVLRMT